MIAIQHADLISYVICLSLLEISRTASLVQEEC